MDSTWLPKCLHWPFCPGVFIAILAFMAAAVTFRKEPGAREKAAWTFLFLGLMCAEVWMMGKDRQANEDSQKEANGSQLAGFKAIGDGIQSSINQSNQQFAATMAGIKQNISTVTGGNTYCVVMVSYIGTGFLLVANAQGDNPLHEVTVDMVDLDIERKTKLFTFEAIQGFTTHLRIPFLAPTNQHAGQMLTTIPIGNVDKRNFRFNFYSMNGTWGENLSLRLVNGQWIQAIKVTKQGKNNNEKILYTLVPDGYPKVNGKVDW
jgi:hypothetical protein